MTFFLGRWVGKVRLLLSSSISYFSTNFFNPPANSRHKTINRPHYSKCLLSLTMTFIFPAQSIFSYFQVSSYCANSIHFLNLRQFGLPPYPAPQLQQQPQLHNSELPSLLTISFFLLVQSTYSHFYCAYSIYSLNLRRFGLSPYFRLRCLRSTTTSAS